MLGITMAGHFAPDKINARSSGAVPKPLVEAVLPFIAVGAPDFEPGVAFNEMPVRSVRFAERLHLELLQPGHDDAKPFVIGQKAMGRDAHLRCVPVLHHGEKHRNVFAFIGRYGMTVHFIGAHQEFRKSLRSQGKDNRQADRTPD